MEKINLVLENNIKTFSTQKSVEEYSSDYLRTSEKSFIELYIKKGDKVLDLGCGAGRTTKYIKERGAIVIGVDLSEPLIMKAKELHPEIEFKVMNALHLDYPDKTFDVVLFSFNGIDNIFPLEERVKCLHEVRRVLKDGGVFAYSSHNSLALPKTLFGFKNFFRNIPSFRVGFYYRKEKYEVGDLVQYYNNVWSEQKILQSTGFKISEILVNGKVNKLPSFLKFIMERFPLYIAKK